MKRILFILTLLLFKISFGQYFNTKKDTVYEDGKITGLTETIDNITIIDFPNKSAEDLFTSVQNFVEINYVNPDNVAKGSIEGKYYRFSGTTNIPICIKFMGKTCNYSTYKYTIEVKFKENRIRLNLISWEVLIDGVYRDAVQGWYTATYKKRKGMQDDPNGKANIDAYMTVLNDVAKGIVAQIENPEEEDW